MPSSIVSFGEVRAILHRLPVAPDESRILGVEEKGGSATVRLWDMVGNRSIGALIPSACEKNSALRAVAAAIASSSEICP